MSNWIPPGHGESHTDADTLWNRPDRGLPPIVQVVDELLTDADARLVEVARRLGVGKKEERDAA
jgi:hypothetical protein